MRRAPRWTPGEVPLAVSPHGLVALRQDPGLLERMWQGLEDGQGLEEVLQTLVSACGGNVFTLPDFLAVVVEDDAVRVVGRGPFQVRLTSDGVEHVFSAPEVLVWDEARFTGPRDLTVLLEPGEAGRDDLPLRSGLVRASALRWGRPGADPGPTSPPGPVTQTADPDGAAVPTEAVPVTSREPGPVRDSGATLRPEDVDPYTGSRQPQGPPDPLAPGPSVLDAPDPLATDSLAPAPRSGVQTGLQADARPAPQDGTRSDAQAEPLAQPAPQAPGDAPQGTGEGTAERVEEDYFGHLFEATTKGGVEDAAIRQVASDDVSPLEAASARHATDPDGDRSRTGRHAVEQPGTLPQPTAGTGQQWQHDGRTVSAAQLRAARAAMGQEDGAAPAPGPEQAAGPVVLAAFCPVHHPNPVHATVCRECGAAVTSVTGMVGRPPLGLLRVSTGATAVLDADVVVGRLPRATTRSGAPAPHLIAVPSPGKAVSRSHCVIRVEGWDLTVEDLGSINGTVLMRPGEVPRRLPENQAAFLRVGDVIDLGDEVTLTIEALTTPDHF